METTTGIEYRWLEQSELEVVEPLFKARGWVRLNPEMSRVIAAFDGDKMIGVCCFQLIPHVEPLFVELPFRGTPVAVNLVQQMVNFLYEVDAPAAYVLADNPVSAKLAELHGMTRVDVPVYRLVR